MRARGRTGGFTLVELAASVAVAAIALVATAAALASGASLTRSTIEEEAAARAATCVMEQIRATPFDQIMSRFDGTTQRVWSPGVDDETGTSTITITPVDTGSSRWLCYEVTIETKWRSGVGATTSKFVTYVSDRTTGDQ